MKQHEQALLFLKKASADSTLLSEIVSSERISDEIFGFHAQQAAEKLLKALLSEKSVNFPRTHNLRLLMDLLADAGLSLPSSLADLDLLTSYGTLFRYEDIPAETALDRHAALAMVTALTELVERTLGIC